VLKKLLKYDLKKMFKLLVWFYAISLVLAGITRLFNIWSNIQIIQIIGSIFAGLTYSAIATIIVNTFIHILLRFSTSFYKDQSYLTHTLPVKKDLLIVSKYLSSIIVILASVLVSFLSLFIIFYSPEFMQNLKMAINGIVSGLDMSSGMFVFLIFLIIFTQMCAYISFAFTAIVKGYSYNHKRGIKGFLWFVCYYSICMFSTVVLAVIITAITGNLNNLFAETMPSDVFLTILIIALVSYILYAICFYFICKKEFEKGVNVD